MTDDTMTNGAITRAAPERLNSLLKKCFLNAAVPERLEAAVDSAAVAARAELGPFPFVQESRVFQQSVSVARWST